MLRLRRAYVTSIHHVSIEYTEIYINSRIEVGVLTRLLQGSGDGAKVVVKELRILIPVPVCGLLKKAKLKEVRS